jgi:nucleotide-binding universal stress UspA family protein
LGSAAEYGGLKDRLGARPADALPWGGSAATGSSVAAAGPILNPIVAVGGFAEIDPAVEWVSQLAAHGRPRVTFAHVVDTALLVRGLGTAGLSAVEFIADARRDGERVLELLRAAAPNSISVTTRLLETRQSPADAILRAAADVPGCDAVVVGTPPGRTPLSSTARMIRRLRARRSVPVVVLMRG